MPVALEVERPRAWLRYGLDYLGFPIQLRSSIQHERARHPGTGLTLNALETRGLIECHYVLPTGFDEHQLEVRLKPPPAAAAPGGGGWTTAGCAT